MRQPQRLNSHGLIVASFLNAGPHSGRKRIARIVEMLQKNGGPPMWKRGGATYGEIDVRGGYRWVRATDPASIQKALSRYKLPLQVDIPAATPEGLPQRGSREAEAARSLVAITEGGRLDRLRLCHCGQWFMALDARRTQCSRACRQKKYASRQEFKENRKIHMKNRYAEQTAKRIKWAAEYAAKHHRAVWDGLYKGRMASFVSSKCGKYVERLARRRKKTVFSQVKVGLKWVSLHEEEIRKAVVQRVR